MKCKTKFSKKKTESEIERMCMRVCVTSQLFNVQNGMRIYKFNQKRIQTATKLKLRKQAKQGKTALQQIYEFLFFIYDKHPNTHSVIETSVLGTQ